MMRKEENDVLINVKELRNTLAKIIEGARRGRKYTVLYRSRPAFRIVPAGDPSPSCDINIEQDPLYRMSALGSSASGDLAENHDEIIYGEQS
jgi:antitoxin (DNA-binding transcriptional repressor) of toxin-antitoxin stability system